MFPQTRMRRLRKNANIRALNAEIRLSTADFIYPIFVIEGENIKNEISSMPGICQYSLDRVDEEIERAIQSGIKAIIFFGIPAAKDEMGSGAYAEDGIIQKALRQTRAKYPNLILLADVCLCEYTSHGHCGVLQDGKVLNDPTLPLLAKTAVSYARAGADIVAPSDMMDGRVGAIRDALDEAGFIDVAVMAYSVKYASAFYGPFREAAGDSSPKCGDRKTYQMDPASGTRQAIAEAELDVLEGCDYIIVKPALAYLDLVKEVHENFTQPVVAYNVSGEYSMVKAAAQNGWIDEKKIVLEMLIGMKRAGSDMIITYHAIDAANWLKDEQ